MCLILLCIKCSPRISSFTGSFVAYSRPQYKASPDKTSKEQICVSLSEAMGSFCVLKNIQDSLKEC